MKKNCITMKVHPSFRNFLKSKAAEEGKTIIDLTKEWSGKKNGKKDLFMFKI
jgi:hypothetical protein